MTGKGFPQRLGIKNKWKKTHSLEREFQAAISKLLITSAEL